MTSEKCVFCLLNMFDRLREKPRGVEYYVTLSVFSKGKLFKLSQMDDKIFIRDDMLARCAHFFVSESTYMSHDNGREFLQMPSPGSKTEKRKGKIFADFPSPLMPASLASLNAYSSKVFIQFSTFSNS